MALPTPYTLPVSGKVFSITLPDSEEWFAFFFGALTVLFEARTWVESDGGLTVQETIDAYLVALGALGFDDGESE